MSERNNLVYFLNSVQYLLPFENEKDFTKKINESKEFGYFNQYGRLFGRNFWSVPRICKHWTPHYQKNRWWFDENLFY